MPNSDIFAAIDLGSNSFHMVVARIVDNHVHVLDRLREMVRLADGLDAQNNLDEQTAQRALDTLARFGQRLADIPEPNIRAVGTNTLRKARNSQGFLERAQEALGCPIDIIAGREEARLIYLGVSHNVALNGDRCLVMDIGGGSTELIAGRQFSPEVMESLFMGCVSITRRYFGDGTISRAAMEQAIMHARIEAQPHAHAYRAYGWDHAIGASGTIKSIGAIAGELNPKGGRTITLKTLRTIVDLTVEAGHIDKIKLPTLSKERQPVFAGGLAVLTGVFEELGIEQMQVSDWALREGLIYDNIGHHHDDVRQRTIQSLQSRYGVDTAQAARVEATVLDLYRQVAQPWSLEASEYGDLLRWAAQLHEIGLAIAHSGYHKHGAYLVANSDLPGFSRREQGQLAILLRLHRRKFSPTLLEPLAKARKAIEKLLILLRLAVLLNRSHSRETSPSPQLSVSADTLTLEFIPGWLDDHPLTRCELDRELGALKGSRFNLLYR